MGIKLTNNAFATLATGINSSATSITLTTGQGARFPTLAGGDYFYATLIDTSNNLEIVKCTARSTDVLTVVRAQETTTARAYNTGDRIEIRITAATFTDATALTPAAVSDQANSSTGYFDLPSGTTAQRPGSPGTGMIRHNSTTGYPEWYDGTAWQTIQPSTYAIQYVVVAGGGGGGGWVGSGGGAGGYRSSVTGESSGGGGSAEATINALTGTAYTVTIGGGGAGSSIAPGGSPTTTGANGSDSVFGTITSVGGGRGAAWNAVGATSGGSGGGFDNGQTGSRAGTAGQGYQGGIGSAVPNYAGSGGGGAGQVGQDATTVVGGNGGNGVQTSINGTATYFAGGGGGGVNTPVSGSAPGSGGLGGGGAGRQSNGVSGTAPSGSANTGGGGGGDGLSGPASQTTGGNGGSGIVIIRYTGGQRGTGGTVTSSGGYTIHTFTSSGTYTA